jgi:type IV pilus assembly protein PilV
MKNRSAPLGARRQQGVSLIEILVAMVLLAVGLLGLAGLQLRGIQVNQGSQYRSLAEIMAEDLADRLRADPTNAPQFAAAAFTFTPVAGTPSTASSVPAVNAWLNEVATLPAGVATANAVGAVATQQPLLSPLLSNCGNQLPCATITQLGGGKPTPIQIAILWNDARASSGANPNDANSVGSYLMTAELSDSY